MNTPLISIIIPAHNNETTIGVAIDSMLSQTYSNTEIIIIDDNSTDNTPNIAKQYEKLHKKVKFYPLPYDDPNRVNKRGRNVNAGYMARNYGLEKVTGEWITFQDADDASLQNRIEAEYILAIRFESKHVCLQWQKLSPEKVFAIGDRHAYFRSGLQGCIPLRFYFEGKRHQHLEMLSILL